MATYDDLNTSGSNAAAAPRYLAHVDKKARLIDDWVSTGVATYSLILRLDPQPF